MTTRETATEVLIVGAGPTGLALAAQLGEFGVPFRIIDRLEDRARESRALGVQARTLELLQTFRLGEPLVARGSTSTRLVLHANSRLLAEVSLGDIGAIDTRFPFILFVSQVETEALLAEHLRAGGVAIERGVELVAAEQDVDHARCSIRYIDGREEVVRASYLVGCDGAHSTVRRIAGIPFEGGSYPQSFVLGDVDADGPLTPGAINAFVGSGVAMFFPLGRPTTWRVIAMATDGNNRVGKDAPDRDELSLTELQAMLDVPTGASVRVRDPAWITRFRLHHRQTTRYRAGRMFLAGDAAHIHSPVGAQGMNTGIQDAWNLGWKLALVARGAADPRLLDTYEAERWPVGHFLLRYTDRAFGTFTRAMSSSALAEWARRAVMPTVLPPVFGSTRLRSRAFRFISELGIRYRHSPAVAEGEPRLRLGPRAGDRLPDARITVDGRATWLQEEIVGPRLALLLCGDVDTWDVYELVEIREAYRDILAVHHLTTRERPGALLCEGGSALERLGVSGASAAQYLVRPDGYIAFRCAGSGLGAAKGYLSEWFTPRG
jgi:2-polyprenyl-6-methoxyphenol hydroxylase-like FAD-dependent oxidoreductase